VYFDCDFDLRFILIFDLISNVVAVVFKCQCEVSCRAACSLHAECFSAAIFLLVSDHPVCAASKRYFAFPSGSEDRTVRIWDLSTWQQVAELRGHTSYVTSVAFDGSGKYLASGEVAEA
jgi:WD40 repeat protein